MYKTVSVLSMKNMTVLVIQKRTQKQAKYMKTNKIQHCDKILLTMCSFLQMWSLVKQRNTLKKLFFLQIYVSLSLGKDLSVF